MLFSGKWSAAKSVNNQEDVKLYAEFIEAAGCQCAFCGGTTKLSPKVPLGYFHVCLGDRDLPDEPVNWITLCDICVDFNSLQNLREKGSFVEAPWIRQGRLTNILKVCYAVSLRPEANWGELKTAAEDFLNKIDETPSACKDVNWDGSVSTLEAALSRAIHSFDNESYINSLRFRFDLEPYKKALSYWSTSIEYIALGSSDLEDGVEECH